ncbi:hypothetical protein KTT_44620 [Tengunoibacter tsumagoiensis]|uniref:Uncharacterized protein n=1 Tax=Tengunoibacter tsumagoiensis TaxID=2014871 RepID=A0A402A632_9CHLR|nr:hypothetical protein KTT_44620 [Tengunoibacter tsumagoiensis]
MMTCVEAIETLFYPGSPGWNKVSMASTNRRKSILSLYNTNHDDADIINAPSTECSVDQD